MILTACKDFSIDPAKSWMIGDADRDIEMGHNARLRGTIRVKGEKPINVKADYTVESILELSGILNKLL
jgi:D-glycero-D-manno-heptose 1,7-bisphosphate phosphatase